MLLLCLVACTDIPPVPSENWDDDFCSYSGSPTRHKVTHETSDTARLPTATEDWGVENLTSPSSIMNYGPHDHLMFSLTNSKSPPPIFQPGQKMIQKLLRKPPSLEQSRVQRTGTTTSLTSQSLLDLLPVLRITPQDKSLAASYMQAPLPNPVKQSKSSTPRKLVRCPECNFPLVSGGGHRNDLSGAGGDLDFGAQGLGKTALPRLIRVVLLSNTPRLYLFLPGYSLLHPSLNNFQ